MSHPQSRLTEDQRRRRSVALVYDADIRVTPVDGRPGFFVTTSKDRKRVYLTSRETCTCHAGRAGDRICCHRTAVRLAQGEPLEAPFPLEDPDRRDELTLIVMDADGRLDEAVA